MKQQTGNTFNLESADVNGKPQSAETLTALELGLFLGRIAEVMAEQGGTLTFANMHGTMTITANRGSQSLAEFLAS